MHRGHRGAIQGWEAHGVEVVVSDSIPPNDLGMGSSAPGLCLTDPIAEVQGCVGAAPNGPVASLVKRNRGRPVGSRNRSRNEPSGNVGEGGGATGQIDASGDGEGPARRGKHFTAMECLSIAKAWAYQSSRGPS